MVQTGCSGDTISRRKPVLAAVCQIGEGTCGTAYLAQYGYHRVAAKVSPSTDTEGDSLVQEYQTYDHLRRLGLEGKLTPRCLGLYKCEEMTLLLTAYSGYALEDFKLLSIEDRLSIFRAAYTLEDAGINQGSFSPRNVVCDDNHVYRIIDFHRGTYEAGRKADLKQMQGDYFHLEEDGEWGEELELGWRHIVPLPDTDDSDLIEENTVAE